MTDKKERIWFADIEAYSLKYFEKYNDIKPYATICKDLNDNFIFEVDTTDFFNKLFSQKEQHHVIYVHYGGGYDFRFWLSELKERASLTPSHNFNFFSKDKVIYYMTYTIKTEEYLKDWKGNLIWTGRRNQKTNKKVYKSRKYTKTFTFIDTYRLWPFSLEELGKAVGLEKLDYEEYDITDIFNTNQDYINWKDGKAYEYIHRDVDILIKFYKETQDLFDIKDNYTLASAAFKDMCSLNENLKYSRRWLESVELWKIIHNAFYGGFTWVNPKHQLKRLNNIYKYDVNSLYPSVMRTAALPFGYPIFEETKFPERIRYYEIKFTKAVAKSIPFMSKGKKDKSFEDLINILNDDDFDTLLGLEEEYPYTLTSQTRIISSTMLTHFEKWYAIQDLEKTFICEFKTRYGMFDEYIDKWTEQKEKYKKEPAKYLIAKLFLNTTFGRFAMGITLNKGKIDKLEELEDWGALIRETKEMLWVNGKTATRLNNNYIFHKEKQEIKTWEVNKGNGIKKMIDDVSYIPLAETITAVARMTTLEPILENPDVLVYADTDSLHTTIPLDNVLEIHPTELGKWDFEGKIGTAIYRRAKHYLNIDVELDGKIKDYELKGGGFNVKEYNKNKKITPEMYLQETFIVKNGKKGKFESYGKPIIIGLDYTFTMPKSFKR